MNLESLQREMLAYLESTDFAVFYGVPRAAEGSATASWDVERYPDYRAFLEVARKAGTRIVLLSAAEFDEADIEDLEEQIGLSDLSADARRECKTRLRDLRQRAGQKCSVELAFDCDSRLYVYLARADWYDEFLTLEDEVLAHVSDGEDDDDETLGGYFSRN